MRHHLLQSNWWASNVINFHSRRCRNRLVHGSTGRRQSTKHAIPINMPSTIPYGMWQNTCSAQQHCLTVRQCGFSHSTVESNSHSNGKQHSSTTITSIHLTSTRRRGTFPSNIDGTSESTQATAWKQLQHTSHKQTSHHAMDGETRGLPAEQVCNTCRWQHQLLQTLEQGTQDTNLWIWWNSSIHVANSKTNAKDGSQILSSNLAWQRYLNKWEHLGHHQQSGQIKNHQKTGQAWEVQQATSGWHQQYTDDNSNSIKLCHATDSKDDGKITDDNRDTNISSTGRAISHDGSTNTSQPPAITDLPMATAPPTQRPRAPLPVPTPKRDVADEVAEGSASKQQRTATKQTAPTRPEATAEPPATRTRITAVTVKTKKGQEIKALSNEDEQEATTEKILLEPWVKNTEDWTKSKQLKEWNKR